VSLEALLKPRTIWAVTSRSGPTARLLLGFFPKCISFWPSHNRSVARWEGCEAYTQCSVRESSACSCSPAAAVPSKRDSSNCKKSSDPNP
jgi:hypothetical protein